MWHPWYGPLTLPWTEVCCHHCQVWKQLSLCRGKVPATINRKNVLNILALLSHLRETSRTGRGPLHKATATVKAISPTSGQCVVSTFTIRTEPAFLATPCFTFTLRHTSTHTQSKHFLRSTPGCTHSLFYLCRVSFGFILIVHTGLFCTCGNDQMTFIHFSIRPSIRPREEFSDPGQSSVMHWLA